IFSGSLKTAGKRQTLMPDEAQCFSHALKMKRLPENPNNHFSGSL
ncbi:hypothetical protein EIKCOROL_02669, partial [Eikenella corrodens ATCC 23834]